jgi:hypothetical protein
LKAPKLNVLSISKYFLENFSAGGSTYFLDGINAESEIKSHVIAAITLKY